jgi:U3 small nucleolar RNA-associated protein 7
MLLFLIKKQIINLDLDHGQYMINYSRNGKNLLMAGSHGHLSLLEWQNKKLVVEFDVKEKIYDTAFIQGDNLFAVNLKLNSR